MEMDKNSILNTVYQSSPLTGVAVGYSYLLKRLFKMRIGAPGNADLEDTIELAGVVALSNITLEYFYDMGVIPRNPIK